MNKFIKLIISFVVVYLAAGLGSLGTFADIPTWYATLEKPILNPPNWIFGPVWTVLYTLMAIALFIVWNNKIKNNLQPFIYFGTQLILNILWSWLFFKFHLVGIALVEIILLWVFILLTIISFSKMSKLSAWLMIPYLIWVSFATFLNYSILILN